jgi:NADH-quinone oxidoreductase subunit L
VLFALALITVFMTAFYMFRAVFMTFGGEYRGAAGNNHGNDSHHGKPHESGPVMVIPLVILAVLAVIAGFWNVYGGFNAFMGHGESGTFLGGLVHPLTQPLPWVALLMGGLGILLAYAMYSARWISAEKVGNIFKPFYNTLINKYWFDKLYEDLIVRGALLKYLFAWFQGLDSKGVDGAVNGIASGALSGGKALRRAETGQLQLYGLGIGIGVLVIVLVLYLA